MEYFGGVVFSVSYNISMPCGVSFATTYYLLIF